MNKFEIDNLWLVSDLHLNSLTSSNVFLDLKVDSSKGDGLIIAGDICVGSKLEYLRGFFHSVSSNYKYVWYVLGNHDFWGLGFSDGKQVFKDFFKDEELDNIFIIDTNSSYVVNDHLLVGDTLWTDFDKKNSRKMLVWKNIMNDAVYIKGSEFSYRQLSALEVYEQHVYELEKLKEKISEATLPVIVCTHHAPSVLSVAAHYKNDLANSYYYTELTEYIMDNPIIKYWLHGHMHNRTSYSINETIVVCNAYGYSKEIREKYNLFKVL